MRSEEAKSLLKKNWGIDGEISSLPSERDINFKVSGKANYVLKIYPKVDSTLKIRLNLQNKVLKFFFHLCGGAGGTGAERLRSIVQGQDQGQERQSPLDLTFGFCVYWLVVNDRDS